MLLTRSPLSPVPKDWFSLDLHVLSAPPAFVLSQDQTLREEWLPTNESPAILTSSMLLKGRSPAGKRENDEVLMSSPSHRAFGKGA